jgi:hypothetical protein
MQLRMFHRGIPPSRCRVSLSRPRFHGNRQYRRPQRRAHQQHRALLGVCHEHIAGLGSIELNIEDRLARLANRISTEDAARIRGSLSARIPIPSIEEQRGVQLTDARAGAALVGELRDMHAASVADHESLVDDFNVYLIQVIPVDDDEDAGPLSLATQDSRTRSVERLVAGSLWPWIRGRFVMPGERRSR